MRKHIPLISKTQFALLCEELPEPVAKTGRPSIPNSELLPGILYVLKTGCSWEYLPDSICKHHYSSCWRRFKFWQTQLKYIWRDMLKVLDAQEQLNLETGQLDTSLVPSPQFSDTTGYSGKHKKTGTKLSLVSDHEGIPLGLEVVPGNIHDSRCAESTVREIRVGKKTRVKQLNADKGYDSKKFRDSMRKRAIQTNIPSRNFKKRRLRGRKPKYDKQVAKQRPLVERTFSWLKSFKRLKHRAERTKLMFEAFALLGCIVICLRRVLQ
jgi:transposase